MCHGAPDVAGAELAIVADSFHTQPLRRFLQSDGRYQVLGLSLHRIRLFEGNRDVLDEIELSSGVPGTITEALGDAPASAEIGPQNTSIKLIHGA